MLSLDYNALTFSKVVSYTDFYNTKLPEITRIKAMINAIKVMFSVTGDRVLVEVAQEERVYKLIFLDNDPKKSVLGWFVYLPKQRRLDLYSPESPMIPIIQWKDKKVKTKNYSRLFDRSGLDKLYTKIVTVS